MSEKDFDLVPECKIDITPAPVKVPAQSATSLQEFKNAILAKQQTMVDVLAKKVNNDKLKQERKEAFLRLQWEEEKTFREQQTKAVLELVKTLSNKMIIIIIILIIIIIKLSVEIIY